MLDALAVALLEAGEDRVRRLDIAGADHVVELELVGLELGDVARQEVAALAVEEIQVAVEHLLRHLLVDRGAAVVRFLQDAADLAGGGFLVVGGCYGTRGKDDGGGAARGTGAEPEDWASTSTARVARIEAVSHPAVRREGLGIIHDARRFGKALHFGVRLERAVQLSKCGNRESIHLCSINFSHAPSNHIARNRDGLDGVARHRSARHLDSDPVPAPGRRTLCT